MGLPEGYPQHLSIFDNTSESSYTGGVCYYEAGDPQILWSRDLRENMGVYKVMRMKVQWLLQKNSHVVPMGGRDSEEQ